MINFFWKSICTYARERVLRLYDAAHKEQTEKHVARACVRRALTVHVPRMSARPRPPDSRAARKCEPSRLLRSACVLVRAVLLRAAEACASRGLSHVRRADRAVRQPRRALLRTSDRSTSSSTVLYSTALCSCAIFSRPISRGQVKLLMLTSASTVFSVL